MGRFEAFAMANGPWQSALDGLGNALGYGIVLTIVAVFRELFGTGKLLGFNIFGNPETGDGLYSIGYMNNNLVILAPFALFAVAIVIWVQRARNKSLIEEH
jgi:Na+-transporting NADH:ubiquinone oxidoreductase subunit D